jgi:hypothetical protein
MSQKRYGSRTAEILASKHTTQLTEEEFGITAREHDSWLRQSIRSRTLREWKEYIKPIVESEKVLPGPDGKGRALRVPRIIEPPPVSDVTVPVIEPLLSASPCVLQTFHWPIPPSQISPLGALPASSDNPQNRPPTTDWMTWFQHADPQSGVLLVGAAGGQGNRVFGVPPAIRFYNEPLGEIEQSISLATLSGFFRGPIGTTLTVYSRLLITIDPPTMPWLARPDTAVMFVNDENDATLYASATAQLTVRAWDLNQGYIAHTLGEVYMFSGWFSNGFEPPVYTVGREVWLRQTVQLNALPPGAPPTLTTTPYEVAISLIGNAYATPVDEGLPHIAVIDLRGTPPEYPGGRLGAISGSNPYKIRLVELRLLTCGRNFAAF